MPHQRIRRESGIATDLGRYDDDGGACDRLFLVASLPDLVCLDLPQHDHTPRRTMYLLSNSNSQQLRLSCMQSGR